jgi:transcriptional regulator of arginine metabolism
MHKYAKNAFKTPPNFMPPSKKTTSADVLKSNISFVNAVKNLLANGKASTQEDIRLSLAKQGILVNQSKISRLLRKLGVIKIFNAEKKTVYSLPLDPLPPPQNSSLGQLILEILTNETMIVIRTNPGSASLIARLLDHHDKSLKILGTLAGDDTLFVVPHSIKTIQKLATQIKNLFKIS